MSGFLSSMVGVGVGVPSPLGGTSIFFDGSNDYISAQGMGNSNAFPTTIEMWIRPSSTSVIGLFDSSTGIAGGIRNYDTNKAARQAEEGTGATFTVTANVWQHIAFVYDDGSIKVYVDGTLNATGSFVTSGQNWTTYSTNGNNNGYWNFGTINDGGAGSYSGYMDEIRVSNIARYTAGFAAPTARFTDDQHTMVLIHGTGANASTTFTDDKTASRTASLITATGNAQLSTAQSKFGGSSVLFDGTRDSVFIAPSQGPSGITIPLGTGQFTIECWVRYITLGGTNQYSGGVIHCNAFTLFVYNNKFYFGIPGTSNDLVQSTTISANTWIHVAVTRNSSNTITLWVDGVSRATKASFTATMTGGDIRLGYTHTVYNVMNGYVDELRISNTARYTAGFTPSASAFTTDANTLTLVSFDGTNGSKVLIDDTRTPNTKTIVALGNTQLSTAQFKFTSLRTAKIITANANAQVDTAQSKFGDASALFDGTGDRLDITSSADLAFGTGDFTIECFVRYASVSGNQTIIDFRDGSGNVNILLGNDGGSVYLYVDGAYRIGRSGTQFTTNTWYHVALSRSSTSTRLFINGTQVHSTYTDSNSYVGTAPDIGELNSSFGLTGYGTIGHIDEFRISKIARYTTTFTPTTTAFTNDADTLLLIHANGNDASTIFTDDNA